MKYAHIPLVLLTVTALIIAGCGGGGGGGGGTGISVSLTAASSTVQPSGSVNLLVAVSGTSNTAVTWDPSGGNVMYVTATSSWIFKAPATIGTYAIRAISVADPTKSATTYIQVSNTTSGITVTIVPDNPVLSPGDSINLQAIVSGTSNTSVTWSDNVTGSGNTVTYTAPATLGVYTVTATSDQDDSKSDSIQIEVSDDTPPPPPPL